jgi:hypothetical protein
MSSRVSPRVSPPASSSSKRTVTKRAYSRWEKQLIDRFTAVRPTDGHPTYALRRKTMLAVDFVMAGGQSMREAVQKGERKRLPPKQKLLLYHAAKGKADRVSVGVERSANGKYMFKYPAADVGGLTNFNQALGQGDGGLVGPAVVAITRNSSPEALRDEVYGAWLRAAGQRSFGRGTRRNCGKFLASLVAFLASDRGRALAVGGARLHCVTMPDERRVLMTAKDAARATGGRYYKRTYSQNPTDFARPCEPGAGDYVSVARNEDDVAFVTANLNARNVRSEYVRAV